MAEAQERLPERLSRALEGVSEAYKDILKRSGVKDEASIISHAAAIYGMAWLMAHLIGRECEEQTARSLEVAKEELRRVADYLGGASKEDHHRLIIRLTAFEMMLYQIAAYCEGAEN